MTAHAHTRPPAALLAAVLVLVLAGPASCWPNIPGTCIGPASDAHGWWAAPGLPYSITVADGSPLVVGQPTTLTLSSTSKNFTGFFIMSPAFGVISNASSKSDLYYECGLGHTEKSIKTSVTFSFTPWMDGAVTFTGYVHTTLKPPVWYVLESTLQVGLPTTAVAYPPPAPPAPPHVRYTFTTLLSLRSVNFTKFANPYNDLPNQAGRYFVEKRLLRSSGTSIEWTQFVVRTNVTLSLPSDTTLSGAAIANVAATLATAGGVATSQITTSTTPPLRRQLLQQQNTTVLFEATLANLNSTTLQKAAIALSAAWAANTTVPAIRAGLAAAGVAADVAASFPTASAQMGLSLSFYALASEFNAAAIADLIYNTSTAASPQQLQYLPYNVTLNTYLAGKGANVLPLGGITATPVEYYDALAVPAASNSSGASFCNANGAWCMHWSADVAAGTVTWTVTARTRGYISIAYAERFNVMSPSDTYVAWLLPSTGAAVLSHRFCEYGYDAPTLRSMPASAAVDSVSSADGYVTSTFTTPLPDNVLASVAAGGAAPPVNIIWGIADAVPDSQDGFLVTHGPAVEVDFGAALVDLLCVGENCVLEAPQVARFTKLHAIAAWGSCTTVVAAALANFARRRWFVLERLARASLASVPGLRRLLPAHVAAYGTPEVLLMAGYFITFALYLAHALRMYPYSPGHALGLLLGPSFATALLPVARNSVWVMLLGVSYERAVGFHRATASTALVVVIAHVVAIVNERGLIVLSQKVRTSVGDGSIYGTAAAACFVAMGLLSAPPVRRAAWWLFKASHLTLMPASIVLACLHAHVMYPYLLPPLVLWVLDGILRWVRSARSHEASVHPLGSAVRLDVQTQGALRVAAGQFAYVQVPSVSQAGWHPLTCVCVPGTPSAVSFLVSTGDGPSSFGARIAALATAKDDAPCVRVRLDGPYGAPSLQLQRYEAVILVAGGVGITPCVSIAEQLLLMRAAGGTPLLSASLLWAVRDSGAPDAWLPDFLPRLRESGLFSVTLALTGKDAAADTEQLAAGTIMGRPDMAALLGAEVSAAAGRGTRPERIAVFACGPAGLVDAAACAAGALSCHFHAESFLL